jgi:hypothetical protein
LSSREFAKAMILSTDRNVWGDSDMDYAISDRGEKMKYGFGDE